MCKGSLKVLFLLPDVFLQHGLRKPAICHVLVEQITPVAIFDGTELAEAQGSNSDLITAPPKFGNNVLRQEVSIASGNVYIGIGHSHVAVQYILKFWNQLDLVKENVVHDLRFHMAIDIAEKRVRIPKVFVSAVLKIHAYNALFAHS